MKKFSLLIAIVSSVFAFSQKNEKVLLHNYEGLLKKIIPNDNTESWSLIHNQYARDKVLKAGTKNDYLTQFSGFKLNPHEEDFYYIAASKNGKYTYIKDAAALQNFIGTVDNGEEAALLALAKGYIVDFEFKEYAANYRPAANGYEVEVGKITSSECPLAKSHFIVTVDRKTGKVTEGPDLGRYSELYGKDCQNNPHYAALQKQMDEAKARQEEQRLIQKKMTDKMKKRLEKNRRKD